MPQNAPFHIDSVWFDCERLIDNGNEYCTNRFIALHGADGLTHYFKKQALKDEKEHFALSKEWQNEYSHDCIFMYKPIVEMTTEL